MSLTSSVSASCSVDESSSRLANPAVAAGSAGRVLRGARLARRTVAAGSTGRVLRGAAAAVGGRETREDEVQGREEGGDEGGARGVGEGRGTGGGRRKEGGGQRSLNFYR